MATVSDDAALPLIEDEAIEVRAVASPGFVRSAAEVMPFELTEDEERIIEQAIGHRFQFAPAAGGVATPESAEAFRRGGEMLVTVRRLMRNVAAHYKRYRDPINQLRAAILDMEKCDLTPLERAEEALNPQIGRFDRDQKDAADRERRRLQAIEDERAAAEQRQQVEALRRVAEAEPDKAKAKAIQQEAKSVAALPVVSKKVEAPATQKVAGLGARSEYRCEIEDFMSLVKCIAAGKLPIAAIEPKALAESHAFLDQLAKTMGPQLATLCPGLKVVEKDITTVR
jgi:hypothetical protein